MLVFYGMHHFASRTVGFRPDFCLSCRNEVVAIESRSFDVGHFYWIPLVPLGFRRHWHCRTCGHNPRGERSGIGLQIIGAVVFLIADVFAWITPASADDATFAWAVRLGLPAVALALIVNVRRRRKQDGGLQQRLRRVPPVGDVCPVCSARVSVGPERRCTKCGAVERRAPELAAS